VNATLRQRSDAPTVTRVTVFDATDRRRYERELLAAKQRAEELARARSELIAMLSHDIRAPLTAMTTAVALLEKTSSDPKHARYLRVLRSSSSQALALVDNLLDLSRLNAGRAPLRERTFDLRALIGEVEGTARTAAAHKPDVAVQSRVDEAVPALLRGDRAKIAQVLMNLAMNAVKFTDRGFVSLVVTSREITPESVALEMSVSDTGIGIPAERLPHIFEEFTQASDDIAERYGGTGLGLAICQRLLELYGSHLHVSSTVGQGSTFSFSLTLRPVTESEAPA
jgi:signal transduction histidine kinase